MPDEALITQIENLLAEVIALGGKNEHSQIVPNLTVQDANPTGLTGFVIVSDNRDGDNILAKKVGSVIYSDTDKVNVMFVKGGEAIAFQQGSQSSNNGIWEIVPSTSTDIFYDKGQVGIGTSTPGEELDVAGNITLDQDIVHRGDTDTKITFTTDDIEFTAGNLSMLKLTETAQDIVKIGDTAGGGDVDINFNDGQMFLQGSNGYLSLGHLSPAWQLHVKFASQVRFIAENTAVNGNVWFSMKNDAADWLMGNRGDTSDIYEIHDNSPGGADNSFTIQKGTRRIGMGGVTSPLAQLHVDQYSTTAAIPVLYLDQGDVSEEMIQFATTIGVGNAIEAVGAKTLTTTHFIKVTLPGALTRYFPVGTIA